jgi:hypothetical protein
MTRLKINTAALLKSRYGVFLKHRINHMVINVYILGGKRVIGYDNAEGKRDHRHYYDKEMPYEFKNIKKLFEDFYRDLREARKHEN